MTPRNQQILLVARPNGPVEASQFSLVETPMPVPGPGQVLVQNTWLSLDPYMKGRMSAAKSYARYVELGEVMVGATAGVVLASQHPDFAVGDEVVGMLGWQTHGVADGATLRKVDTARVPLPAYLGVLGTTGLTAWIGLNDLCMPQAGETVVVDAAAGAVGSVVGQLAKLKGCRAVGIAGGADKCAWLRDELGFDAVIDYKAGRLAEDLKAALPAGIDALFENVGGATFDLLLTHMNAFSRIALCGLISDYERSAPTPLSNIRSLLINRIRLQGFIASEFPERAPIARAELIEHVAAGRLKYRETIAHGLENAPQAFMGLLRGENIGKQLVQLR